MQINFYIKIFIVYLQSALVALIGIHHINPLAQAFGFPFLNTFLKIVCILNILYTFAADQSYDKVYEHQKTTSPDRLNPLQKK